MSNPKDFLENFKLKKAIGNYKASLNYGDKLSAFNCLYKIVSSSESGYTILEDEKNSRVAIPTLKLSYLMKKGVITNLGAVNFAKAIPTASRPAGVSPKPQKGVINDKPRGEPVGTRRQGSDGHWYMKVQEQPSKWIHVGEGTPGSGQGTVHDSPNAPAKDLMDNIHPKDHEHYEKMRSRITAEAHPDDHENLLKVADTWIKHIIIGKNLKTAHHMSIDPDTGKPLKSSGISGSAVQALNVHHDKGEQIKKKLINAIVASRMKKR
jgi:hypothetical protein